MSTNDEQPPPVPTAGTPIWELVIADMSERDHVGRQRYGTPLQAGNGRDPLIDAYQESLDKVVYLRQEIEAPASRADLPGNVLAFHRAFDLPVAAEPCVPVDDRVRFRARLIAEEFFETMRALFGDGMYMAAAEGHIATAIDCSTVTVDLPEFVDGLADLEYVCEGAFLEFGVHSPAIYSEVQRSNMAKVNGPLREDGKRLKPPGWTPPDIAGALAR